MFYTCNENQEKNNMVGTSELSSADRKFYNLSSSCVLLPQHVGHSSIGTNNMLPLVFTLSYATSLSLS